MTSPASGTVGQTGYTPAYTTQFLYSPGQTRVVQGYGSSGPLTTTYSLDDQGEPITTTDGLGNSSSAAYDVDHDVLARTDAYDVDHDVLARTDADGHQTSYQYQYVGPSGSIGLLTTTTRPAIPAYSPGGALYPVTTTNVYTPTTDDLLQTSDSEGRLTVYTYDGHHGVLTTTDRLCSTANSTTACGSYTPSSAPLALSPSRSGPALAPLSLSVTYLRRGTIHSYDQ